MKPRLKWYRLGVEVARGPVVVLHLWRWTWTFGR